MWPDPSVRGCHLVQWPDPGWQNEKVIGLSAGKGLIILCMALVDSWKTNPGRSIHESKVSRVERRYSHAMSMMIKMRRGSNIITTKEDRGSI